MNIIFEGPDGAGKSTLIQQLSELLGRPPVFHHGPYNDLSSEALCWEYHRKVTPGRHSLVLHDRSWLSEPIYGTVHRGGSRIDAAQRRALERQAGDALVVLCMPPFEDCRAAFEARRQNEMLKDDHALLQVYARYVSLASQTHLEVIMHDRTVGHPKALYYQLRKHLNSVRKPQILIVGEQANIKDKEPIAERAPFTAYNKQGCSHWLNSQLDAAEIPETALCWVNAVDELGRPAKPDILRRFSIWAPIIALGQVADKWCRDHNRPPYVTLRHPQHHKRFSHNEEYPLATILKELINV